MGVDYSVSIVRGRNLAGHFDEICTLMEEKYDEDLYDFLWELCKEIRKTIPEIGELRIISESSYGDEETYVLGMYLFDKDEFEAWAVVLEEVQKDEENVQKYLNFYWDYFEKNYPDLFAILDTIPETTYLMGRVH